MEQCLPKKLKGSDGLPVPVGDDAPKSNAGGAVLNVSQSVEHDNALKDGRNGNTSAKRAKRNDGAESEQIIDIDVEVNSLIKGKANETSTSVSQNTVAPVNFTSYVEAQYENAGNSSACVVSAGVGLLSDVLALDERQLKRERRKQANRESARKSRLRKQAEYEDLVNRWDSLKMENTALKSELEQLNANSEKLRRENAALMEKLEASGVAQKGEMVSNNVGADSTLTNNIEKVQEKSDTLSGKVHPDHNNTHENTKSETKLHQLLDSSSRTDTVAAR